MLAGRDASDDKSRKIVRFLILYFASLFNQLLSHVLDDVVLETNVDKLSLEVVKELYLLATQFNLKKLRERYAMSLSRSLTAENVLSVSAVLQLKCSDASSVPSCAHGTMKVWMVVVLRCGPITQFESKCSQAMKRILSSLLCL